MQMRLHETVFGKSCCYGADQAEEKRGGMSSKKGFPCAHKETNHQ